MLTSPFLFCQIAYPKKAVIDKDTVCIITIEQTRLLDKVFIEKDECNELKDSLNSELNNYGDLVNDQKQIIASQDTQIVIQKKIIQEKNNIIKDDDKLLKKAERKNKWLRIEEVVCSSLGVIIGAIVTHVITN